MPLPWFTLSHQQSHPLLFLHYQRNADTVKKANNISVLFRPFERISETIAHMITVLRFILGNGTAEHVYPALLLIFFFGHFGATPAAHAGSQARG